MYQQEYYGNNDYRDYLMHYGVKGMKWGKHLFAKDYLVKAGSGIKSAASSVKREINSASRMRQLRKAQKKTNRPIGSYSAQKEIQVGDNKKTTRTTLSSGYGEKDGQKRSNRDLKPGYFTTGDNRGTTWRNPKEYENTNAQGRSTKRDEYVRANPNVYGTGDIVEKKKAQEDGLKRTRKEKTRRVTKKTIELAQERGKARTEQLREGDEDYYRDQFVESLNQYAESMQPYIETWLQTDEAKRIQEKAAEEMRKELKRRGIIGR